MTAAAAGQPPGDPVEAPRAGLFTRTARRAAINTALPLLVTYFADAPTWDLEVTEQLASRPDPVLDDLTAAVRLRASLAAAQRLLDILHSVAARPTFRYTQVSSESVGTIRGRLDVARYSRQQGRITVPRRYPIRLVERATATPENILAAYAALWIRRDLLNTPQGLLPPRSPELRDLRRCIDALNRTLSLPLLAGTTPHADDIWRRQRLPDLLDRVRQRLTAGHIAHPEPYQHLVDWIAASRDGAPVADVGDREWSFYDERFDTKLFEIWCLQHLAAAITELAGEPVHTVATLTRQNSGPIYTWNIGAGTLRLHFQPSLADLTQAGPVWRYQPGNDPLRGFPDLAVTAETVAGRGLALFDPKLRQRTHAPTEEIYKLLGYFTNLQHTPPPAGAIFYYHRPGSTDYHLTTEAGGEVHALGLDPEQERPHLFQIAAGIALRCSGLGDTALSLLRQPNTDPDAEPHERAAAVRQAVAVEAMARAAQALPPATLDPTRKNLANTLRAIWSRLGQQAQTMIVTADYFANTAPDNADHSGPLLGVAAAFERVLHDGLFDQAAALTPNGISAGQTLGSCLRTLDNALQGRLDVEAKALLRVMRRRQNLDLRRLRQIVPAAKTMNRRYRIPAAHAELVSAETWSDGRESLLHPTTGLLPRLVMALDLQPQQPVAPPP